MAQFLEGLGGTAGGGFSVHTRHFRAQTIDGERSLTTVIAQRPGSTSASPIVILAHRDAVAPGSRAEMSGTGALLELARVFATRETRRTIVLVSTSGGSGGDAGAADFAAHFNGPLDAAIVLGDLAGTDARKPFVVPFSDGFGSAPIELQRTLDGGDLTGNRRKPGRAQHDRPARPPRVPLRRRRTGTARRQRAARRARPGQRRTGTHSRRSP